MQAANYWTSPPTNVIKQAPNYSNHQLLQVLKQAPANLSKRHL